MMMRQREYKMRDLEAEAESEMSKEVKIGKTLREKNYLKKLQRG